jgi:hypothetical protein
VRDNLLTQKNLRYKTILTAMTSPRVSFGSTPVTSDIRPVTAHIGAEIGGVDLRKPLTEGEVAAIRVLRRVTIAGPPAR